MKNLNFDLYGAGLAGDMRHAQTAMKEMGIEYKHAVPMSVVDAWFFFNCTGNIDHLPSYITEIKSSPLQLSGLTKEDAEKIIATTKAYEDQTS